jgi:predicted CoA-binding protein
MLGAHAYLVFVMARSDLNSIQAFLSGHRIAFVGLSVHPNDFSRGVDRELVANGYEVIPVRPGVDEVAGRKAYPRVSAIPTQVDGVLVMTPPSAVPAIIEDCVVAGKPRVWLHRGVGHGSVSEDAVAIAAREGIELVVGECPLMFLPNASGIHRLHAWAKKAAGTYPHTPHAHGAPPPAPLALGSALSMVAVDWAIYFATLLGGLLALKIGIVLGAVLAGGLTWWFERRSHALAGVRLWSKAVAAAIIVALPLPIMGTLLGVIALAWLALSETRRHRLTTRRHLV